MDWPTDSERQWEWEYGEYGEWPCGIKIAPERDGDKLSEGKHKEEDDGGVTPAPGPKFVGSHDYKGATSE